MTVGIQCKSCGSRALVKPDYVKDPGLPKFGHEIMDKMRQSPGKCLKCGGSDFHYITLTGGTADKWLEGSPSQ
jgi:DNA-directed RNA polymerase subunit RPC12/RpoP